MDGDPREDYRYPSFLRSRMLAAGLACGLSVEEAEATIRRYEREEWDAFYGIGNTKVG